MAVNILDRIRAWHIITACAALYICGLTAALSLNGDDAIYILLGKSFLQRGFFHEVFVSNELARSSYYYFMLPLMLTPFIAFAPANYLAMKIIPLASTVIALILLNMLLKGSVPDRYRKAILFLFGINPWVLEYSNLILTDMPYIAFMLTCFVSLKRYEEKKSWRMLALSAVLAGIALYTRPIGAALCLSLPVYAALKRRWRECLAILVILAVMAVPVFVHAGDLCSVFINSFVAKQDYYAYASPQADAGRIMIRAGRTLLVYAGSYLPDLLARTAAASIDPRIPDGRINPLFILKFLIGVSICALIASGFARTARRSLQPYHVYASLHLFMLLIISVYVARYLFPLLPFILIFMAAAFITGRAKESIPAAAIAVVIAALSLAGSGQEMAHARAGYLTAEEASFVECNDWVRANTPESAVILSRKPSYTELYTGRRSAGYIITDDPAEQIKYIASKGIDFVIVGDLGFYLREAEYIKKMVRRYPEMFRLRYTTSARPENYVYEVL